MIFEGEYLNDQKNGIGKAYYYSRVNSNDHHHNYFCKICNVKKSINSDSIINPFLYFPFNQLQSIDRIERFEAFEGEYLNGIRWNGKGKEFNNNKKIIFEGYYINGKKVGQFKEYNSKDILIFDGEYVDGKKNGKGKEYYDNGKLKFEGEYLNGERNGKGKEYYEKYHNLMFEGEYKNGERNGKGKEYKYGKIIYEGEYVNGKRINL